MNEAIRNYNTKEKITSKKELLEDEVNKMRIKKGKSKFRIKKIGKLFSGIKFGFRFNSYKSRIYDKTYVYLIGKTLNCYIELYLFGLELQIGLMN